VEDVISFKVKLISILDTVSTVFLSWMVFQCPRYSSLVSLSSGNILGSTDEMLEDWGLRICGPFAGLLDGPGSGDAVLLTSILGITSDLACRVQ
jgi:hypothetical protein